MAVTRRIVPKDGGHMGDMALWVMRWPTTCALGARVWLHGVHSTEMVVGEVQVGSRYIKCLGLLKVHVV